jgi:hypothetical protein
MTAEWRSAGEESSVGSASGSGWTFGDVAALTKIFIAEIERLLCAAAGVTSDANTPTAARPRLGCCSS